MCHRINATESYFSPFLNKGSMKHMQKKGAAAFSYHFHILKIEENVLSAVFFFFFLKEVLVRMW